MKVLIYLIENLYIILISTVLFFLVILSFLYLKTFNKSNFLIKNYFNDNLKNLNNLIFFSNSNIHKLDNINSNKQKNITLDYAHLLTNFYTQKLNLQFYNFFYYVNICFYFLCALISIIVYLGPSFIQISLLSNNIYSIGNWKEFGINIKASQLVYLLTAWISCIFCFIIIQLKREKANVLINILILSIFFGVILMLFTFDIFNFYVACEISSVAVYGIATYSTNINIINKKKISLFAGLNYLIYGSVASFFILLGIGFLIFTKQEFIFSTFIDAANNINKINILNQVSNINNVDLYYFIGILLLFIGLAIKLSIPPLICIVNLVYRILNSTIGVLIASVFFIPFWYLIYNLKIIQTIVNFLNIILHNNSFLKEYLNIDGYSIIILILSSCLILIIKNYFAYKKINQDNYFYFNIRFFKKTIISYILASNILYIFAINFNEYNFILFLIYESAIKFLIFLLLIFLDRITIIYKILNNAIDKISIKEEIYNNGEIYNLRIFLSKKDLFFLNTAIILISLHIFSAPIMSIFTFKIAILIELLKQNLILSFFIIIILSAIIPILLFNSIKDLFFILNTELKLEFTKKINNLNTQVNNVNNQENFIKKIKI
ncbi:MAG: hypothetical protein U1E31_02425 [Rickettsiales bacterium]